MKLSDLIQRRPLRVAFGTSQQTGALTSVDLEATRTGSEVVISASDGSVAPVAGADDSTAGVMTATDKTRLDALPPTSLQAFASRAGIGGVSVAAAITHLRTAGYAAAGDGGGALYQRAGTEPAHALKVQSADGAWWELVPEAGAIDVRQAGAKGDGVADDGQAFLDALAGVGAFNGSFSNTAVHQVLVPPGDYYLGATTLELKNVVRLTGAGSGMPTAHPARLSWDANVTGIIVHRPDTIGAGKEVTPSGGADGSVIEGLWLSSAGGSIAGVTDATKGHGVWLRGRAVLRSLYLTGFPGNGLNIVATQGGPDDTDGNANNFVVDTVRIQGCQLNGIYVDGADVNAGVVRLADVSSNGRWGIWDSSFLGNTYVACHAATNGVATVAANGADQSSFVSFGGQRYSANVAATEADLVATQPGTDEDVWISTEPGNAETTVPEWTSGQPAGTYFHGGCYRTDNINAHNVLVGCYAEIRHGVPQFVYPTIWLAGESYRPHGKFGGIGGGSQRMELYGSQRLENAWVAEPSRAIAMTLNARVDAMLQLDAEGDHPSGWALKWDEATGHWAFVHSNLNWRRPLRLTTDLNTRSYGRPSASDVGGGKIAFENGIFLGNELLARFRTTGTGAPGSGTYAKGDIVWNATPSSGAPLGWVCVTAGSPGNWAEIRGIGSQTAGADQAALTNNTGGTRDGTLAAVSGSGADAAINDNFTELHMLLDEVRTALVTFGLMKGGA